MARGVKGEKSRPMSKYPKGNINQHKSLATGAALETCNTKDLDPSGWGPGGKGKGGKVSSSGTTGSPVGGGKVPKTSRSTPA